tara:strand:+ start:1141 stop:1803 length:663 start_codon:yes stop_codon:yes gene_type:complete
MYIHTVAEEWQRILPQHLWIYNKLFLSQRLGYTCGPAGLEVPKPGFYIVRPCMNLMGMGRNARIEWIESDTEHLHPAEFWCEVFEGDHLSVDYEYHEDRTGCYPEYAMDHSVDYHVKRQRLAVKGTRETHDLYKFTKWEKVDVKMPYPHILTTIGLYRYGWINCEFIGDKLIEVHFRRNPDFRFGNTVAIPVWKDEEVKNMENYRFVEDEDYLRRGFYIK